MGHLASQAHFFCGGIGPELNPGGGTLFGSLLAHEVNSVAYYRFVGGKCGAEQKIPGYVAIDTNLRTVLWNQVWLWHVSTCPYMCVTWVAK